MGKTYRKESCKDSIMKMRMKATAYKTLSIGKNKNKYNAKKTTVDGIVFDSIIEGNRYCELKLLQRAGQISDLKWQVPFVLFEKSEHGRKLVYKADFTYMQNGQLVVEDTKSKATKTQVYKLKKRILAEKYGIVIKEVFG